MRAAVNAGGGAILAAAMLAGCTTTGTGVGYADRPGGGAQSATFTWTAQGARTGAMTAALSGGGVYTGPFVQVTSDTQVNDLAPLWIGWGPGRPFGRGYRRFGFGGWDDWGPGDQSITTYSGKVLANLQGPGGRMRCRFTLIHPSDGMAGGGEGDCQLPTGGGIAASFPAR